MGYKILDELCKSQGYEYALLTTFNFDISFFEQVVFPKLFNNGITKVSVFVDAKELTHSLNSVSNTYMGKRYMVNPIKMNGAFHSKIILLLGKNKARLFIGSGNLTTSGYMLNNEIFNDFVYDEKHPENLSLIYSAIGFFVDINKLSYGQDTDLFSEIKSLLYYGKTYTNENTFLWNNLSRPIIEQISDKIDDVTEIRIAVPYYDNELAALNELKNAFPDAHIHLYLQNEKSKFPIEHTLPTDTNINVFETVKANKSSRFYHGKVFMLSNNDYSIIVYGSANCTSSAILKSFSEGGNIETVVCEKGLIDEFSFFDDSFELIDKPLSCGVLEYTDSYFSKVQFAYGIVDKQIELYLNVSPNSEIKAAFYNDDKLAIERKKDGLICVSLPVDIVNELADIFPIRVIVDDIEETVNCWLINKIDLSFNREVKRDLQIEKYEEHSEGEKYLSDRYVLLRAMAFTKDEISRDNMLVKDIEESKDKSEDDGEGIVDYIIPTAEQTERYTVLKAIDNICRNTSVSYFSRYNHSAEEKSNINKNSTSLQSKEVRSVSSDEYKFAGFVKSKVKQFLSPEYVELVSAEKYLSIILVFCNVFDKYYRSFYEDNGETKYLFDDSYICETKSKMLLNLLNKSDVLEVRKKKILNIAILIVLENLFVYECDEYLKTSYSKKVMKRLDQLFDIRDKQYLIYVYENWQHVIPTQTNSISNSTLKTIDDLFEYKPLESVKKSFRDDYGTDALIELKYGILSIELKSNNLAEFGYLRPNSFYELNRYIKVKGGINRLYVHITRNEMKKAVDLMMEKEFYVDWPNENCQVDSYKSKATYKSGKIEIQNMKINEH